MIVSMETGVASHRTCCSHRKIVWWPSLSAPRTRRCPRAPAPSLRSGSSQSGRIWGLGQSRAPTCKVPTVLQPPGTPNMDPFRGENRIGTSTCCWTQRVAKPNVSSKPQCYQAEKRASPSPGTSISWKKMNTTLLIFSKENKKRFDSSAANTDRSTASPLFCIPRVRC